MTFDVAVKEPGACSGAELSAFRDLVVLGDEVDPHGLEGRIQNARALAFGYLDGNLVGVAAVKFQAPDYRYGIFQKARIAELSADYVYELGWVFVVSGQRGKGCSVELVKKLLDALGAERIYSTSKTGNTPMHRTLAKLGFTGAGNPWRSKRGSYDLAMYLRPAPQPSAAADAPQAARR